MTFVSELEPQAVWRHFDEILTIPRASKREGRIREHVIEVAERAGLEHRVDDAGNVVVRKPGTAASGGSDPVVVQSHLDMVQEKNSDVEHDWETDPIRPVRDGEWLTADGTTLGSDNGIGVAAMLTLAEADDLVHPPLELLFTVDEETGLTGAGGLAEDMLEGRRLLNLDSEEEGVLTIGCAGGADTHLDVRLAATAPTAGAVARSVRVAGLRGGHSGVDIHRQRANAIRVIARALEAAWLERPFHVAGIRGGNAHNAIPREATAVVVCESAEAAEALSRRARAEFEAAAAEYAVVDPDMTLAVGEAALPESAWTEEDSGRALALLLGLPHGVERMSDDIEGLVETSTNLAVVRPTDGGAHVHLSSRSSVGSALAALRGRIGAVGRLAGATVEHEAGYPGWKPDVSSELLAVVEEVHREVTGREPEVGAVHAGLECGIIGEKYAGMDMISFGPQIEYPHSPDERVEIPTVASFWKLLTRTLERLA